MNEVIKLNKEQQLLIEEINKIGEDKEFLKIIFTGSAGTGKTTTLVQAIKKIKEKGLHLKILVPTHQSGIVIQKMLIENNLEQFVVHVNTIHSYFDISPEITEKGERRFIPKLTDQEIQEDIFIIDEASMVNKEILDIILKKLKLKHIIFVGDKYQLPPVKEEYSMVFELPKTDSNYKTIALEKIMRTKKNLEIFEKLRNYIKRFEEENYKISFKDLYNEILSNFILYEESQFPEIFNKFIEERFKKEKYVKIGSFTNNFVDFYNLHFRNFDNEVKEKDKVFSEGDKIILNKPYNFIVFDTKDKLNESFFFSASNVLKNGEEVKIKEAKDIILELNKTYELRRIYNQVNKNKNKNYIILPEKIKKPKLNISLLKTTEDKILVTTYHEETKKFIEELFDLAKEYTLIEKNKNKRKNFWRFVYSISDKIIEVNYAYASTIHKLQGQTIDEVFLDIRDFVHLYKTDYNLFLRLLYVGITRTSNEVHILK